MGGLKEYLRQCAAQAPTAYRASVILVTILIGGTLALGWNLNALPGWEVPAGGVAFTFLYLLLVFPYQLWRQNRTTIAQLEERLGPKLKCSFNMSDPGCRVAGITLNGGEKCDWYRIKAEADAVLVSGCKGVLTEIKKSDVVVMAGEKLSFGFTHGSAAEAFSKTVQPGIPEYLDLLFITYNNRVSLVFAGAHIPATVDWANLFATAGDYSMRITITSSTAPPVPLEIFLAWTGDWRTAKLDLRRLQ